MAQATRKIVIDAPPETVMAVIADFAKYAEFLPEVKGTQLEKRGKDVEVTYDVDLKIKRIKYTLRHVQDSPLKTTWSLVKGEFMKGNDGSWTLAPLEDGKKTEATYLIELKLGALVPSSIEKALAEGSLPALLENFKKRSEAK